MESKLKNLGRIIQLIWVPTWSK